MTGRTNACLSQGVFVPLYVQPVIFRTTSHLFNLLGLTEICSMTILGGAYSRRSYCWIQPGRIVRACFCWKSFSCSAKLNVAHPMFPSHQLIPVFWSNGRNQCMLCLVEKRHFARAFVILSPKLTFYVCSNGKAFKKFECHSADVLHLCFTAVEIIFV